MSGGSERAPGEVAELERSDEALRDGIGEEDNAIPLWFNASFVGTLIFGVIYILWYTLSGWSASDQYAAQSARLEEQFAAVRKDVATTNPYRGDAAAIAEGKEVFSTICVACHLADGRGMVGPSLIDPYWKYGHSDQELFTTVSEGRPGGMPAWKTQLSSDKIWKALAYLETLPKTDEPGIGAPGYVAPQPGG
jgi:cytochrome c oxidase cbb3-type subunit 3